MGVLLNPGTWEQGQRQLVSQPGPSGAEAPQHPAPATDTSHALNDGDASTQWGVARDHSSAASTRTAQSFRLASERIPIRTKANSVNRDNVPNCTSPIPAPSN